MKNDQNIIHTGVRGMKWGVNRWRNPDGTLNEAGKKRYGIGSSKTDAELRQEIQDIQNRNKFIQYQTARSTKAQKDIQTAISYTGQTAGSYTKMVGGYRKQLGDTVKGKRDEELGKKITSASSAVSEPVSKALTKKQAEAEKAEAVEKLSELDSKELSQIVQRLDLEKQYNDLTSSKEGASLIEKGKAYLDTFLTAGTAILTVAELVNLVKKGTKKKDEKEKKDKKDDAVAHSGVKGMKKGVRRYQNPDGSLTPEGYRHYGIDPNSDRRAATAQVAEEQRRAYERERSISEQRQDQKAERQKMREFYKTQRMAARTEAKIRKIETKSDIATQKAYDKQALEAKKASQKATRKNIFKYAIGGTALAGLAYLGYSKIKRANLKFENKLELDKIALKGKQEIDKIMAEKAKTEPEKAKTEPDKKDVAKETPVKTEEMKKKESITDDLQKKVNSAQGAKNKSDKRTEEAKAALEAYKKRHTAELKYYETHSPADVRNELKDDADKAKIELESLKNLKTKVDGKEKAAVNKSIKEQEELLSEKKNKLDSFDDRQKEYKKLIEKYEKEQQNNEVLKKKLTGLKTKLTKSKK